MSSTNPPNADLAELSALLGIDNVKALVHTFLREYPRLLDELKSADAKTRTRVAHSLKSNTRIVGARALSTRMAAIEQQLLAEPAYEVPPAEIASLTAEFAAVARPLRDFAGEA